MRHIFLSAALLIAGTWPALAQEQPLQQDLLLSSDQANRVAMAVANRVGPGYVDAAIAAKMTAAIRHEIADGRFAKIRSSDKLASLLTDELQTLSKDLHLRVIYSFDAIPEQDADEQRPSPERELRLKATNQGFVGIEYLEHNVGYLDLRMFADTPRSHQLAEAAMTVLASTDALIIDLRQNGGGEPPMAAFLASYFFPHSVLLDRIEWRKGNHTEDIRTIDMASGSRYLDKPVYVLISSNTFSAAEEFAYDLQALKRVVVVGEESGGGANLGGTYRLSEHFMLWLPIGRFVNPLTKVNWENSGVSPDVKVSADKALEAALALASKKPAGSR